MKRFDFVVDNYEDITVRYNDQLLFHQHWSNVLSFEGNVASAAAAAERIVQEMAESGRLAAKAGKEMAARAANNGVNGD